MSRTRHLSPGFFRNEILAELPPLTRMAFQGLWCEADREGRLEDRPKKLKAAILPYDDIDFDQITQQLHDKGFIFRYAINGCKYIQIINFLKYQKPSPREIPSIIPAMPERNQDTPEHNPGDAQAQPKRTPSKNKATPEHTSYSSSASTSYSEQQAALHATPAREGKPPSNGSAKPGFAGFAFSDEEINLLTKSAGTRNLKLIKKLVTQLEDEIRAGLRDAPYSKNRLGVFKYASKIVTEMAVNHEDYNLNEKGHPPMTFGG